MRLWHEALIPYLPRQQLLGQHRECCALRDKGWGKRHSVVNYVFEHPIEWLIAYHDVVMMEMDKRGYKVDDKWFDARYRGKKIGYSAYNYHELRKMTMRTVNELVYPEHDAAYLQECLDNLASKGIVINLPEEVLK